jgi:phenol 2-monooxygenase (NADPH)
LCAQLDAPTSFLRRISGNGSIDGIVEILTIHSAPRHSVELLQDFPEILHPFSRQTGWSYHKVYCDDVSVYGGSGNAYASYGVDKDRGCVVVVRPDQIVAWVGGLDDFDDLQSYFNGCLVFQ